jgi:hypothetical protein
LIFWVLLLFIVSSKRRERNYKYKKKIVEIQNKLEKGITMKSLFFFFFFFLKKKLSLVLTFWLCFNKKKRTRARAKKEWD